MRKVLVLAVGLALVGTSAWSQGMSRDDYGRRERWHDDDRPDGGRDRDRGGHHDRMMHGDMMHDGERPGRNARFFVRSGDTQLRIVCGDRESTQACIDSALRLFDRVQSQPRAATSAPASPAPAPQSAPQ